MSEPLGRHELKHSINLADVLQLRAKLPFIAKPDENSLSDNGYRVKSLYFDNYNDKVLKEKLDGVDNREKFRLRLYNNDISFIRLEKKSKKNGLCYKQSALLTEQECRQIIKGEYGVLKENGNPLCLELYVKMRYELLRPKNIVDYHREAYVYPPGNVRVTLDYDIRTDYNIQNFFTPMPALITLPGVYILEVKYDDFLPEIIRGMVSLSSRKSGAFSKYAISRIM